MIPPSPTMISVTSREVTLKISSSWSQSIPFVLSVPFYNPIIQNQSWIKTKTTKSVHSIFHNKSLENSTGAELLASGLALALLLASMYKCTAKVTSGTITLAWKWGNFPKKVAIYNGNIMIDCGMLRSVSGKANVDGAWDTKLLPKKSVKNVDLPNKKCELPSKVKIALRKMRSTDVLD